MCIVCDPRRHETLKTRVWLNCHDCPLLTTIPVLPNLVSLYCSNCPNLATIPVGLAKLEILTCRECPLLTRLPALPRLRALYCNECPSLAALPALPALEHLDCDPWINHHLNERLRSVRKAARTLARRRLKKLRYVRFKKFISTPAYSAYLNAPGHIGHRIETAQLRKLGSERT